MSATRLFINCEFDYHLVMKKKGLTHFSKVDLKKHIAQGQSVSSLSDAKAFFLKFCENQKTIFLMLTQKMKKKEFSFKFEIKGQSSDISVTEKFSSIFMLLNFFQNQGVMTYEEISAFLQSSQLEKIPEYQDALIMNGYKLDAEFKKQGCAIM